MTQASNSHYLRDTLQRIEIEIGVSPPPLQVRDHPLRNFRLLCQLRLRKSLRHSKTPDRDPNPETQAGFRWCAAILIARSRDVVGVTSCTRLKSARRQIFASSSDSSAGKSGTMAPAAPAF